LSGCDEGLMMMNGVAHGNPKQSPTLWLELLPAHVPLWERIFYQLIRWDCFQKKVDATSRLLDSTLSDPADCTTHFCEFILCTDKICNMGTGDRFKHQGIPEPLSDAHFAKLKRKAGLPADDVPVPD